MSVISFVIVSPDSRFDAPLEACGEVEILDRVSDLEKLVDVVLKERPDALLLSLEGNPEAMFETLDKLLAPRPLLFFHGPDDSRLILRAMRSGAVEYVAAGIDEQEQLTAAIRRAGNAVAAAPSPTPGALIAVVGAKGGVGASFVACQLAASLANEGARTALVDGHLRLGDVALYLDLAPKHDLASLAAREEPIDASHLRAALAPHASGVAVLAGPRDPEHADAVDARCIESVRELLRAEFDWVVWDTPNDFDDRSLRVLDRASTILLVTTSDVPALNHTKMQLELFARLGRSERDVRVVRNRSDAGASVSARDVEKFLQRPIDASIPNDYRRASTCVNEGCTVTEVAPRSPIGNAVCELGHLAHTWCDRPAPERPKRGLLDRLRGR